MENQIHDLIKIIHEFKHLDIGVLFDEFSKGEYITLSVIDKVNKKQMQNPGKVHIGMLKESMKCSAPAVSRTVSNLEKKGLVVRSVNEKDRRNTNIILTENGKNVLVKANKEIERFSDVIADKMGDEKIEQMIELLEELYDIAKSEIDKMEVK